MEIVVPDPLIEEAECQWAPRTDPVFELVPVECEEHISSVYAKLGNPAVNFYSFWDVYNRLSDAVNSDFLARTTIGTFTRHEGPESMSEDGDAVEQLPLSNLRPCRFGENGVPAERIYEGEADTSVSRAILPDILTLH